MNKYFVVFSLFISIVFSASRTTPPTGSIVVSQNPSSGQFSTIQSAVNSLSTTSTTAQIIFIEPGTYNEQVYIAPRKAKLTVYGYTTNTSTYSSNVVIIAHNSSILTGATNDDATGTVRNWAANSDFYNINMKNTYGKGSQALALSASAGNQGYYAVGLFGYQDTLLSETGFQVFARSYIEGATDFIFGQHASTWITFSDIRIKGQGAITANGRSSSTDPSYYVINECTVATASGVSLSAGSAFLGRPWSEYARVVFQGCSLSSIINSAGWEIWSSSTPNTADVLFGEFNNNGAGSEGTRASFSTKLSSEVTISTILGSNYTSWVDTSYL